MTAEVRHSFRQMKNPAHVGQLRTKTWAMPVFITDRDGESPLWQERSRTYWERQQHLYGLVMSNFTNLVEPPDPVEGKPAFLSTYSVVLAILPGERVKTMETTQ